MFLVDTLSRLAVVGQPLFVRAIRLLDAAVVGYVLALRYDAVDSDAADFVHFVASILRHQTVGALMEHFDCCFAPPPIQIAVLIKQSSFVIETMSPANSQFNFGFIYQLANQLKHLKLTIRDLLPHRCRQN